MKKVLLIFLIYIASQNIYGQVLSVENIDSLIYELNDSARSYYKTGNYEKAANLTEEIIHLKQEFKPDKPQILNNNYMNLSNLYSLLSRYDDALKYLQKVYDLYSYNNNLYKKAEVLHYYGFFYRKLNDYNKSLEYYKESIDILESIEKKTGLNERYLDKLVLGYFNLGIINFELDNKDLGTQYFLKATKKSKNVKRKIEIFNALSNYLTEFGDHSAKKYFNATLNIIDPEIHKKEFIIFNVDYATYLYKVEKDYDQAIEHLEKASILTSKYFGEKSYLHNYIHSLLAEVYCDNGNNEEALKYAQLYLIDNTEQFNSKDFKDNPTLIKGNFKYPLIDMLLVKAKACYNLYKITKKLDFLDVASNSLMLSIDGINQVRFRIDNENSKFQVTKKQINTFKLAQQVVYEKYLTSKDEKDKEELFHIAEKSKSFSLLSSMRTMKAFNYGEIPEQLLKKEEDLNQKLSLYNEMIFNEKMQDQPREDHIQIWEQYVLELGRKYDSLIFHFEKNYPNYYKLKYDNNIVSPKELMSDLDKDKAIIEYSLTDSLLFIYLINGKGYKVVTKGIDSSLTNNCMKFYNVLTTQSFSNNVHDTYQEYLRLSYEIYSDLLKPIEKEIRGKELLIVPDGAISFVPFDALITKKVKSDAVNYYDLPYLIKHNAVSTTYSATIHFKELVNHFDINEEVLAFAPSYEKLSTKIFNNRSIKQKADVKKLVNIPGVRAEVERISKLTGATSFMDASASETNFKKYSGEYGILHLAMHTLLDDEDPMYSKLAFTPAADTANDGFLHTYEIYNMKFKANLAVLSSCESGYGELREGEGIQSLARSFAYAGCPSILMTLWEVSDQSTIAIMERFYYHLQRGESKSKALQLAKLEFLENADLLRSNPFFWSSFTIMGNADPIYPVPAGVVLKKTGIFLFPLLLLILLVGSIRQRRKNKFFR